MSILQKQQLILREAKELLHSETTSKEWILNLPDCIVNHLIFSSNADTQQSYENLREEMYILVRIFLYICK